MTTRSNPLDAWLAAAIADAERRGLSELKPLLETMAGSTAALRAADDALSARDPRLESQAKPLE
jgi:hypothetical protein